MLVLDLGYDGEPILGAFATAEGARAAAEQYVKEHRFCSPLAVYSIPLGQLVDPDYLSLHRTEVYRLE